MATTGSKIGLTSLGLLTMGLAGSAIASIYWEYYGRDAPGIIFGLFIGFMYLCALPFVLIPSAIIVAKSDTARLGSFMTGGFSGIMLCLWMVATTWVNMTFGTGSACRWVGHPP